MTICENPWLSRPPVLLNGISPCKSVKGMELNEKGAVFQVLL